MNILSYKDVESYLSNKQIYFREGVKNTDSLLMVEGGKVHNVTDVSIDRFNKHTVVLEMNINNEVFLILAKGTDLDLFAWVRSNFIIIDDLVSNLDDG